VRSVGLLVLLLASCGNGDDTSSPAPVAAAAASDASLADASHAADASAVDAHPLEASVAEPHPAATVADISKAHLGTTPCTPGPPSDAGPTCSQYLCCIDNAPCSWGAQCVAGSGDVAINITASAAEPSGAVAYTITAPPFHGLCFSAPGAAVPTWCESIAATPGLSSANDESVGVLITLNNSIAGSPAYDWEACYLPGTLTATESGQCTDRGGYCCFSAHPLGKLDTAGNPAFGIPPGDYWFAMHSMPDVSSDGPEPFAQWAPDGVFAQDNDN
jgi:hypothetical protein